MYLLLKGDFKSALSTINEFNRSDQHYIRVIGKEWLIYQYLLFILIHYERENYDIAENKIKVLLRKYHTFLNQKSSIGVFAYIKLIKRIIEGYQIKPKQLDDYFQLHFEEIENNNTDVFLKSFYAWVKAKVYKKSTYTTLLELLSNEKAKATGNYT